MHDMYGTDASARAYATTVRHDVTQAKWHMYLTYGVGTAEDKFVLFYSLCTEFESLKR